MKYDLVQLEQKEVAGIKIRTSNSDPNMSSSIGLTWQRFYEEGIYQSIPNKKNVKSIGLYTNYENGVSGEYDVIVCCEVDDILNMPESLYTTLIPSGKYAKFIVHGNMQKAVADFWTEFWSMELDRKFGCDFEEYQNNDMENGEIFIYISLN